MLKVSRKIADVPLLILEVDGFAVDTYAQNLEAIADPLPFSILLSNNEIGEYCGS